MRIPLIEPYKETAPEEKIYVPHQELERPNTLLITDKDKVKYIKYIEKMVRSSYEYKEYIKYLTDVCEMSFCSAFQNLTKDLVGKKLKLEIHHEPFTLFDIVNVVLRRFMNAGKDINEYDLSDKVLELHFRGMVGLIPLSYTVHQLVHVGKVFIPLQCLDDGFMKFYQEYKQEVSECELEGTLIKKIELSKTFNFKSNSVLHKKYIYVDNEGYDNIPEELRLSE